MVVANDIDLSAPVELVPLSVEDRAVRCRVLAGDHLVTLRLEDRDSWDPLQEYWGEPILARGPRSAFELEQVLPGAYAEGSDYDPITESNDMKDAGDYRGAHKILMGLCEADLRCLDAHAHLGNLIFDSLPKEAIRHYEVGLRIGELSLGGGIGRCSGVERSRQPSVPALHAWLRTVPLAAWTRRRGGARVQPYAMAQPVGQPGGAVPVRTRQGG